MNTYDHPAFQVSAMNQAIEFYVSQLGFTLVSRSVNAEEQEAYAFLALADLRLELIQDLSTSAYARPTVQPPYCPHLAIRTDDMGQTVARLKSTGVAILRGPLEVKGEDTWVHFCDPDNNILEYVQWFGNEQSGQETVR
jgi:catechol 2,3-dioxygenase-like lactoylglutathione lyase family enzyme